MGVLSLPLPWTINLTPTPGPPSLRQAGPAHDSQRFV